MNEGCEAVPRERDSLRILVIVAYVCLLAGIVTAHLAAVAGVIIAYVQRDDARCTVWYSHYQAIITTFWVALAGYVIGIPLCFVLIGIPLLGILAIWYLYRIIRGLVHAIDDKPF